MSWAAHNPEAYEECERVAVADLLVRDLKANGFDYIERDTVEMLVEVLQAEHRKAFDELVVKAQVGEAMADHLIRSAGL